MSRRLRLTRLSALLAAAGLAFVLAAVAVATADARQAAAQTWPPFVLVAGLLAIGVVAHRDGLFSTVAARASRLGGHPAMLLAALLMLVATVTAVLNLDTAVAFLTPVLVLAARSRGVDEEPFLYGSLLMANAASLLLPGSNLTNLLVLSGEHVPGAVFATRMLPAWLAAVAVTMAFAVVLQRRGVAPATAGEPTNEEVRSSRPAWAIVAVAGAAGCVLGFRSPAVPVAGLAAATAALAVGRGSVSVSDLWTAVDPASLAGVFGIAVGFGTLGRAWAGPAHLMAHANAAATAAVGAVASVLINNLPAAVLLGSGHPAHPRALLLGLNLGPNLAVTGSLSALIWYRAATAAGSKPRAARLSRLGLVLVPLSITASAVALRLFAPVPL